MKTIRINSLSLPGLEPYLTMRRPVEHREKGVFVAEGEKVVRRLVGSRLEIVSILLTDEWFEEYTPLLEQREIEDGIYIGGRSLLEEIVGYRLHQGIMAIGKVPEPADVFERGKTTVEPRLLVALDGIANSENMGVIVRNCAAFGVDVVIVGETSCDPYLRRSVRNSMGTIFQLPTAKVDNLAETMKELRDRYRTDIIAAHPHEGSDKITDVDLTGEVCIVFGSEGEGISPGVLNACNRRLTVPMKSAVDSLNVGSSVGVVLYEASRQRGDARDGWDT
ncbi:MAG: RNA methyltransferase [Bacteroidetes bacterium]|nr:RNA methyltransferase [Bacteroidota bacterium]